MHDVNGGKKKFLEMWEYFFLWNVVTQTELTDSLYFKIFPTMLLAQPISQCGAI